MTANQTANNEIVGNIPDCITPELMVDWFNTKAFDKDCKLQTDLITLAALFLEEGIDQGVRGDIAFCQSIKETGWFRYGGQVLPEQNNYAGIGATNNSPVGKGAWFESPRIGVRAQIQHLYAYAVKGGDLVYPCVDPRFNLVTRGAAGNAWTGLNGRWAVPGDGYGESILSIWEEMYKYCDEHYEDDFMEEAADVPSGWATKDWEWAVDNGITDGTNPKGAITREQAAVMVHRAYDLLRLNLMNGLVNLMDPLAESGEVWGINNE